MLYRQAFWPHRDSGFDARTLPPGPGALLGSRRRHLHDLVFEVGSAGIAKTMDQSASGEERHHGN